jgi:hypothetical protein
MPRTNHNIPCPNCKSVGTIRFVPRNPTRWKGQPCKRNELKSDHLMTCGLLYPVCFKCKSYVDLTDDQSHEIYESFISRSTVFGDY